MNNTDKTYILKIILIIIIFLSINVLSTQIFKTAQLDLTNDKMYTISNVTPPGSRRWGGVPPPRLTGHDALIVHTAYDRGATES